MSTKKTSEKWQEQAPKLAQMEKINPFVVPEGYFDTLSDRIADRIAQESKTPAGWRIVPMWTRYAAAACLTFVLGITLYLHLKQQTPNNLNWNEIPDQAIVSYLESNLEDADTELIFEQLSPEQQTVEIKNYNQQDLETYLNQNL